MTILSIILGFTLFFVTHTLNATYNAFNNKREVLFYGIDIVILIITVFCLSIPYHYFQPFDTILFIFLIIINLATIALIFFVSKRSETIKESEDKFGLYVSLPLILFLFANLSAGAINRNFTQTVDTQPTTAILYKTELNSDVTLSYYRNTPFANQKDVYPTTFTTLQELQEFEKKYKDSNPTVVVTAQGATSEMKAKTEFQLKLNPISDETLAMQLATPDNIQINITQIRLTKLERTQIQWLDVLFQTNYKVQGDPITILEIDYEITNLEQLQNAKEVQHKLDNLLQNVK